MIREGSVFLLFAGDVHDGSWTAMPGTYADCVGKLRDEYLPVAKLSRAKYLLRRFEDFFYWHLTHDGLYLYLRDEIYAVFLSPIDLLMPTLKPTAEYLADGQPEHADIVQCLQQVIELIGARDDLYFCEFLTFVHLFHLMPLPVRGRFR